MTIVASWTFLFVFIFVCARFICCYLHYCHFVHFVQCNYDAGFWFYLFHYYESFTAPLSFLTAYYPTSVHFVVILGLPISSASLPSLSSIFLPLFRSWISFSGPVFSCFFLPMLIAWHLPFFRHHAFFICPKWNKLYSAAATTAAAAATAATTSTITAAAASSAAATTTTNAEDATTKPKLQIQATNSTAFCFFCTGLGIYPPVIQGPWFNGNVRN